MIKSKFEHRIFITFAPNELDCSVCSVNSSFTDSLTEAVREFSNLGFEIYESRLVTRSFPDKDGENDG